MLRRLAIGVLGRLLLLLLSVLLLRLLGVLLLRLLGVLLLLRVLRLLSVLLLRVLWLLRVLLVCLRVSNTRALDGMTRLTILVANERFMVRLLRFYFILLGRIAWFAILRTAAATNENQDNTHTDEAEDTKKNTSYVGAKF